MIQKKKRVFGLKAIALVAFVSILAGIFLTARFDLVNPTGAQNFWKDAASSPAVMPGAPANFVELAKGLSPMVVNISTTQVIKERQAVPFPEFKGPFDEFFGDDLNKFFNEPNREMKKQSLGSGFIINKEGYILTNYHVIENATEIIVTLSEKKMEYRAKVVGQDQKLDIALIKIEGVGELPVATLGDSEALQIGEWVLAIGNPFGLGGTVTSGIVSQKGRIIGAGPYDNFIQTDASINPGNSGGPLFNMAGEVVGINTAIVAGGQGIGFATPINMVKDVLAQLRDKGRITRGWIGVSIQELTPELARSFGLKESKGVLITSVTPGDPAEQAGLRAGDIIISFDNRPIDELSDLPRTVAATPPGKTVEVRVLRDTREKSLSLKVSTKVEEELIEAKQGAEKEPPVDKRLGLSVGPLTSELAKKLGLASAEGVYVSSIRPGSPAAEEGLRRGDVIREIDRKPVRNVKDYAKALAEAEKKEVVLLLIVRGSNNIYVVLKIRE